MTRARLALVAVAALALASCGGPHTPAASGSETQPAAAPRGSLPPPPAVHVPHQPPTAKDVIDAAIASAGVPLRASTTCAGVGTEPSDASIGRYLAGFMAEMSEPDKKNWIETRVEPGTSNTGEPVSICTLTLRHEDGNDRWGWGVRFSVRSSDGLVLPDSFSCVGAG